MSIMANAWEHHRSGINSPHVFKRHHGIAGSGREPYGRICETKETFDSCLSGCHPQPLAVVRPCSWTFTSVAIFGSHNRCQSSSDFSLTMRPVPATWRRLAGATGSFAPIVRRRESRSASQIVLASCAAAGAAVIRR